MIAYGFMAEFGPNLEFGATKPKTLTMRRSRKLPSRHATVGEPIGLWTGLRQKGARRRGVGIVTLTCLLRFSEHGMTYVSDLRVHDATDDATAALQRELLDRDGDAVARRDGFENYASMWAWHFANRTKEEKAEGGAIVRNVIAWKPLSEEHAAAIDAGARVEEPV